MELKIEMDAAAMLKAIDEAPKVAGRAILRSVKRGTASGRTLMARLVAKDMGLKVGEVRNQIIMKEPRANDDVPTGELRASLERIPLYKFQAKGPFPSRGRGRGVSYKGEGGRKRISDAFIARMSSGHMGVFKRGLKTPIRRPPKYSALPIYELFGPSIGRVFAKHQPEVMARAQEQITKELERNLRFFLEQQNAA